MEQGAQLKPKLSENPQSQIFCHCEGGTTACLPAGRKQSPLKPEEIASSFVPHSSQSDCVTIESTRQSHHPSCKVSHYSICFVESPMIY